MEKNIAKRSQNNWSGEYRASARYPILNYSGWALSSFSGDKYAGDYEFSSGIRANVTDSALVETMKEIKNYLQGGPTQQEVAFMKSAIVSGMH